LRINIALCIYIYAVLYISINSTFYMMYLLICNLLEFEKKTKNIYFGLTIFLYWKSGLI